MLGETHSEETHSEETKIKKNLALSGKNRSIFGKTHSEKSKNRISISDGPVIYVYSSEGKTLINSSLCY